MTGVKEKLIRLREMDFTEVRFRVAQKLRSKRRQWQIALDGEQFVHADWWQYWETEKISDPKFRAALEAGDLRSVTSLIPEYFLNRKEPFFYWDSKQRRRLATLVRKVFPLRARELQAEAEAISEHRFRIFAYPEVSCGLQIPWRRDMVHGVESGLVYHARVPFLDFSKVGDSKNVWEINRHQHFVTLCQAHLLTTGENGFAEECLSQWEDWMRENPYLRGINWASSLEVAFRSWSWIWTFFLLLESRALTGERMGRLTQALSRNAAFITENLSTYFAPNTHLLGEGFALFVTGLLFPELKDSSSWREQGRQILIREMQQQVRADGSHFEQSLFYHRYAVEFFLCAAILGDRNGCPFPGAYKERLEGMFEYLAHTSFPSGLQPSIGDSDGGRLIPFGSFDAQDPRDVLSTGAVYFHRGDFRKAAGGLHEQTLWLLGAEAETEFAGLEIKVPAETSRTFPAAGIVTQRSDWDAGAKFLIFDAGPQGMGAGGHGHADALSFLCSANGIDWLIDPGTYVYSASLPWRDFFRSTPAHNTLAIDGLDQAVRVDWFKWRELPRVHLEASSTHPLLDYAVASHTGYARLREPVSYRRRIAFVKPQYWVISDELTGLGRHRVAIFFHFAPGVSVQAVDQGWLARKSDRQFLVAPIAPGVQFRVVAGEESPMQGWYSSDYGHREPACVLVGEIETAVPVDFHWLLYPVEDELPVFRDSSRRTFSVQTSKWTDSIVFRGNEGETSNRNFSTDAAVGVLRRDGSGTIERVALVGGNSLWSEGQEILRADKLFDCFVAEWHADHLEIEASPAHPFRLQSPPMHEVRINGKTPALVQDRGTLVFQGEN